MQEFDPKGHSFKIGRYTYHLPLLSLDIAGEFYQKQSDSEAELVAWMPKMLAERASCDRPALIRWLTGMPSPERAVKSLAISQQVRLFQEWLKSSGVMPGESSRSANL